MAANNTILADEDGDFSDWIEIHNPDPAPLNLAGLAFDRQRRLSGQVANFPRCRWRRASGSWCGRRGRIASGPGRRANTTRISVSAAAAKYLALVRPDGDDRGAVVRRATIGEYPQQFGDISFGLAPITSVETYFLTPTPGTANGGPTSSNPGQRIADQRDHVPSVVGEFRPRSTSSFSITAAYP